jgi:tetratricopeptide (TPR) repeat protein
LALGGADREEANAFLRQQTLLSQNQNALIADQRHHLREQLKQIHLDIWEKRLGVWLRAATFCVGVAAASGVAMMVWQAAHSSGLIIEQFTVPPDLAAKGLSGEAVAGQILDQLTRMQDVTISSRPPQTYARYWGENAKVEIPETGISIDEFQKFLRGWLGHDTRISGDVWHTPTGLAVAVRTNGTGGEPATGSEADFDDLMHKAAELVYASTQPYRYANYLDRNYYRPGVPLRIAEAEAIYNRLIYDPDPLERGWAWNGLGTIAYSIHGNDQEASRLYHKALSAQPDLVIAYSALIGTEERLGHAEAALQAAQNYRRLTSNVTGSYSVAEWQGDFSTEASLCERAAEAPIRFRQVANRDQYRDCVTRALALQHDGDAVRKWVKDMPPTETVASAGRRPFVMLRVYAALEQWNAIVASEAAAEQAYIKALPGWDLRTGIGLQMRPLLAMAKAHLGDFRAAEALIGATPSDCYDCIRYRGAIASLAGDGRRADYWFSRAVDAAPSISMANEDWGRSLMVRGKPDDAIAQFKLANQKGPHFADPLEGWGEALMAKNQSHLALAKFAEAEKYAPNWGRLHLKWGEALVYAGKKDEAVMQFARAAQLDLTSSEKSELTRMTNA